MSNASNLGYNYSPNSNVTNTWVNKYDSNNPFHFSSNETGLAASGGHGMLGASNNSAASNSCLSGYCNLTQKGGKKILHKYKKGYKMKSKKMKYKKKSNTYKRKNKTGKRRIRRFTKRKSINKRFPFLKYFKKMKGGYHQYQGNVPNTPSYSVGGVQLSAKESALANPAPFTKLGCEGSSCVDNYNHYTNKGFQLWN